jgi:hypothetical protein
MKNVWRRRRRLARRWLSASIAGAMVMSIAPTVGASDQPEYRHGSVYVDVSDAAITIGNSLVERTWSRTGFGTTSFYDKRGSGAAPVGAAQPDFRLFAGSKAAPQVLTSTLLQAGAVEVTEIPRGLRLDMTLSPVDAATAPGFSITRSVEVYNGIAGVRTDSVILSAAPLALRGYTLDELHSPGLAPSIHAFRAGADWRDPTWGGPEFGAIGDAHAGTWRDTKTAGPGEDLDGFGEWISLAENDGRTSFMMMERNDFPSSQAEYKAGTAALVVDHSADILSLGPIEETGHIENPQPGHAGRVRVVTPQNPYEMEATFSGFGRDGSDEAWQFHKYLVHERLETQSHDVTFNSNGTDGNVISTGAKDDMNLATVQEVAPKARALGIETFILDDGWQARSGEWFPDCPGHEEPRYDPAAGPDQKFRPRFPDCTFAAVKQAIAPMKLGLWMNPMHYHPSAATWQQHPEWICQPVGSALHAANAAEPTGSSNEAGLAQWGPNAIPYIESKIDTMVNDWGVEYFKFDFLVWLDCVGQGDLYEFKEAFGAMLDRLIAKHPHVTFTVDETNDYRLFPFESITRGPSWFQNGSPEPHQLLHNIWNLSPWIPASYIGQHFLGGRQYEHYPVDTLMAAALTSHMTFFSDLRQLPDSVVQKAAPWIAFYKANRAAFTQMVYPLLDDPFNQGWTALQSWNPEEGFGALLTFRQKGAAATQAVPMTAVPDGDYDLFEAPTGTFVGTVSAEQLRNGLEFTLAQDGARVLVIRPHTVSGAE